MFRELLPYLPIVVVLLLLVRRTRKPRILKPDRLWILPAIVLAFVAWYAWSAYQLGPALTMNDDLIIAGSFAAGIAVGWIRATLMRIERHPQTGLIEARLTFWGLGFVVLWLLGRLLLRRYGQVDAANAFGVFTDSTVALAAGAILARTLVVYRRCRALESPKVADASAS
jgi:hypothetical protein